MDADELYGLPLDRFVPERDALAKALRAHGRREEAAEVAKLVKPSVAAWAVNQVVRSQPRQAEALWTAGDEVLDAQERVVAGEAGGAVLREAIERQRAALEPLADAARGLVTARAAFLGEQHVQAVVETLHAAAVDRSARDDVAAGRAARPLRLTGLEAVPAAPAGRSSRAAETAESRRGGDEDAGPTSKRGRGSGDEDAGTITRRRRGTGDQGAEGAPKRGRGRSEEDPTASGEDDAATRERLAERRRRDDEAERARRAAEAERVGRRREAQRALVRAERDRDSARARVQDAAAAREEAERQVERAEAALARAENARADAHAELERAEDAVELARAELDAVEG